MKDINIILDRRIVVLLCLVSFLFATSCASQKPQQAEPATADLQTLSKTSNRAVVSATKSAPNNLTSTIYLGSDGKPAGIGLPDQPASEVYRLGKGVHSKALSMPGLPKDKFGLIDWNLMVQKKLITPADTLQGDRQKTPLFDLNILIKTKGDFVNNVMFPHKPHVYWLDCKNCHTGIFVMAKGKNNMSMQEIVKGKWCGRCHGKVSFPLTDCNRCHSHVKP